MTKIKVSEQFCNTLDNVQNADSDEESQQEIDAISGVLRLQFSKHGRNELKLRMKGSGNNKQTYEA